MAFQLTRTSLNPSQIPSDDVIIEAGKNILASTSSWKRGRSYEAHNPATVVRMLSRPAVGGLEGATSWHCRVSEHARELATFDEMWEKLGKDKAVNEMGFIPSLKKVRLVKRLSATQEIWSLYYTFPPPVSPRVFTVLQVLHLDTSTPRTAIICSVPIDLSSEQELASLEWHGTRAMYVAVERLLELEDGRTEWTMAVSSDVGGYIPSFIADKSIPGQIAADVKLFFRWLKTPKAATEKNVTEAENPKASDAASVPRSSNPEGSGS